MEKASQRKEFEAQICILRKVMGEKRITGSIFLRVFTSPFPLLPHPLVLCSEGGVSQEIKEWWSLKSM